MIIRGGRLVIQPRPNYYHTLFKITQRRWNSYWKNAKKELEGDIIRKKRK